MNILKYKFKIYEIFYYVYSSLYSCTLQIVRNKWGLFETAQKVTLKRYLNLVETKPSTPVVCRKCKASKTWPLVSISFSYEVFGREHSC